jgi:hypothetical protein
VTGQGGEGKEEVAYLMFDRPAVLPGAGGGQLAQFLLDLPQHPLGVGPVEADPRRARAELEGPVEGRQGARHVAEEAGVPAR